MTSIEAIVQGVQSLPLPEQIDVARYVHRLDTNVRQKRVDTLRYSHGVLDGADGQAFEQVMVDARRLEVHG